MSRLDYEPHRFVPGPIARRMATMYVRGVMISATVTSVSSITLSIISRAVFFDESFAVPFGDDRS